MLLQKSLKITFSRLAETGIKFTKKSIKTARIAVYSEHFVRFGWVHETLPHACETAQMFASLKAVPETCDVH